MTRPILAAALFSFHAVAAESPWIPLFDGKSLDGWTSPTGGAPGAGWKVEDGSIHRAAAAGDLISAEEYEDFELEFEWKISAKGNSGVKYRVQKSPGGWLGPEYQVLDDAGHPNGKVADTTAASLYEVVPAAKDKNLQPAGEWNRSRIIAKGTVLEHWLNDKLALRIDTAGEEWPDLKKASKFSKAEDFAAPAPGRLLLQDHGDAVWFRKLRVRKL
jgi:hypothetical protein